MRATELLQRIGFERRVGLLAKQRKASWADFGLGALLGLAFFLLVYGPSTLNPAYDGWIYAGYIEEDIIQHYAGWMWYREAPWTLPLTVANNLSQPLGASVAFTDSIPLFAVFFKLLSPILPQTFQYFGLFNLFSCVMQGGFAMLLLRHFKLHCVYAVLGSVLFVCCPVFVERLFRHTALGSQWLILAAMLLYFKARSEKRLPAWGFLALCVLTPALHTYFVPMVYALLAAALLETMLHRKKVLRYLAFLVLCFVGTLAMMYVMGILTRGGGGEADGFGKYSMNLNALINPTSFDWFSEDGRLVWSRLLPVRGQGYYQYDGFNYLGAGVLFGALLLGCYGVVTGAGAVLKKNKQTLNRAKCFVLSHLPLLLVCACLCVFAVSNVVTWDAATLFTLPLPKAVVRLFSLFRSSGRLFWPVHYLLVLSVVVGAARFLQGRGRYILLAILCAVQLFDISGVLLQKHAHFKETIVVENEFTTEGWQFLAESYDEFICLFNMFDYNLAAGIIRYNPAAETNLLLTNQGNFLVIHHSYQGLRDYLRDGGEIYPGQVYLCDDADTFYWILENLHPDARGYQTGEYYAFALPVQGCPLPEYLPGQANS